MEVSQKKRLYLGKLSFSLHPVPLFAALAIGQFVRFVIIYEAFLDWIEVKLTA
jgi:hypothetical protein